MNLCHFARFPLSYQFSLNLILKIMLISQYEYQIKSKPLQIENQNILKSILNKPMRPEKSLTSYAEQQQDQGESLELGYSKEGASAQVQRLKKVIVALIVFILIISVLVAYREFRVSQVVKSGEFYENTLLSYQLDEFWKMSAKQQQEQQANTEMKIISKGEHVISRKELGHNSWTLLHMVTGAFPDEINEVLVKKFNAFLLLFGQMYPCKLCANHFMMLLKQVGPFTGTKKVQLMTYLCNIHNIVNKRLGKPQHSCENIVDEWNSCGCSGDARL